MVINVLCEIITIILLKICFLEIDGNGDFAEVKDLQILVSLEFRRMLVAPAVMIVSF